MTDIRAVDDVIEFVDLCELGSILYAGLHASRGQWEDDETGVEIGFELRDEAASEARFAVRMTLQLRADDAEYKVTVEGRVDLSEPVTLGPGVMGQYLGGTMAFALFPYLRAAVTDLAARVGAKQPLLAFLRPGMIEIQEERTSVFADNPVSDG